MVWRLTLTMPATIEGYVVVEATTPEEAAELALVRGWMDVEWDDRTCSFDKYGVEVFDVECENPPVDAILRCPGRETGANLDALFEPETQTTTAEEQSQQRADEGGEPCK